MQLRRRASSRYGIINSLQRHTNGLIRFTISFSTRHLRSTFHKITNKAINLQRSLIRRAVRLTQHNRQLNFAPTCSFPYSLLKRPLLTMYTRSARRVNRQVFNRRLLYNRKLHRIRARIRQHIVKVKRTAFHLVSLRTKRSRIRRRHISLISTLIKGRLKRIIRYHIRKHRAINGTVRFRTFHNRHRHLNIPISTSRTNIKTYFRRHYKVPNRTRNTVRHSQTKLHRYQYRRIRTVTRRRQLVGHHRIYRWGSVTNGASSTVSRCPYSLSTGWSSRTYLFRVSTQIPAPVAAVSLPEFTWSQDVYNADAHPYLSNS